MDIDEHTEADQLVIALAGRLDSNTAPDLEQALLPRVEERTGVVLDLHRVDYVSSAGLRVLLKAAKIARKQDHRLALAGLTPQVQEVFDISGFTTIFRIYETRQKAIEALR
jgi:anti-sigma B factor antagonist